MSKYQTVSDIIAERDKAQADLAAARALLQSLRSVVAEDYRHHIDAALAGDAER